MSVVSKSLPGLGRCSWGGPYALQQHLAFCGETLVTGGGKGKGRRLTGTERKHSLLSALELWHEDYPWADSPTGLQTHPKP